MYPSPNGNYQGCRNRAIPATAEEYHDLLAIGGCASLLADIRIEATKMETLTREMADHLREMREKGTQRSAHG